MIKSMTGFASLTREDEQVQLTVTVKSVNHRYLDRRRYCQARRLGRVGVDGG